MGVRTMPALVQKVLDAGLSPQTPAILVERATCADQRNIVATLETIAERAATAAPTGPCLLLYGAALAAAAAKSDA